MEDGNVDDQGDDPYGWTDQVTPREKRKFAVEFGTEKSFCKGQWG